MEYVLREMWRTDAYNLALELSYFSKGLACDIMDGVEEGAPGVPELLQRAGKTGLERMAKALEGVANAAQMIVEMLRRAAETGMDFMDIAVEMLAAYWGFRSGGGKASESGVREMEMMEMATNHSQCPTE